MNLGLGIRPFALSAPPLGDREPPMVSGFSVTVSSATATAVSANVGEAAGMRTRYAISTKATKPVVGWTGWSSWDFPDPWLGVVGATITHATMTNGDYIHVEAEIKDLADNLSAGSPHYGFDQYVYIPEG